MEEKKIFLTVEWNILYAAWLISQ